MFKIDNLDQEEIEFLEKQNKFYMNKNIKICFVELSKEFDSADAIDLISRTWGINKEEVEDILCTSDIV